MKLSATSPGVFAGVRVRPFRELDREPLRGIFLRSREAAFFWLVDRRYAPMDFDVSTEGEDVWVAEIDGEAVGFASVSAAESFVHNLFVEPAFAGRGAGAALLAVLTRTYAAPLTLKCLKENERALRFYRRLGWWVEGAGTGPDGDYFNLAFGP